MGRISSLIIFPLQIPYPPHPHAPISLSLQLTVTFSITMLTPLKPPAPPLQPPSPSFPLYTHNRAFSLFITSPKPHHFTLLKPQFPITPTSNFSSFRCQASEIDMVRTKDGIFAPKRSKVVVLWDLDNKPPHGPPYQAALALKKLAQGFGEVVEMCAYANRHAFIHVPNWIIEERRERRRLDVLERKGVVTPSQAYVCSVCGRKCKTHLDLKKHFRQLHERERQKKLSRMNQLKGKKKQRFKERFIDKNYKYEEAARTLIAPKVGYGLEKELRRAGVYVRTVADKPQAADWALKRQMMHSMSRGINWMVLVTDDSDFREMLRRAREADLGTVVVGDQDRALGRHADLWVPWRGVEKGEVREADLVPRRKWEEDDNGGDGEWWNREDGFFSVSGFDEGVSEDGSDLDKVVDKLVVRRTGYNGVRISAFSEGEEEGFGDDGDAGFRSSDDVSELWDSEEDEFEEE